MSDLVDEIVDGGSINWVRIARLGVATVAITIIEYVVGLIQLVGDGVDYILLSISGFIAEFVGVTLDIPLDVGSAVVAEFESFLALFGIAAPVVAVVVIVGSGYLVILSISRAFDIVFGVIL